MESEELVNFSCIPQSKRDLRRHREDVRTLGEAVEATAIAFSPGKLSDMFYCNLFTHQPGLYRRRWRRNHSKGGVEPPFCARRVVRQRKSFLLFPSLKLKPKYRRFIDACQDCNLLPLFETIFSSDSRHHKNLSILSSTKLGHLHKPLRTSSRFAEPSQLGGSLRPARRSPTSQQHQAHRLISQPRLFKRQPSLSSGNDENTCERSRFPYARCQSPSERSRFQRPVHTEKHVPQVSLDAKSGC